MCCPLIATYIWSSILYRPAVFFPNETAIWKSRVANRILGYPGQTTASRFTARPPRAPAASASGAANQALLSLHTVKHYVEHFGLLLAEIWEISNEACLVTYEKDV